MEIRCVKCRFKYDVTINDNQSEATVICPRCGAIQKAVPPHEATETTAGGSSQQPQTGNTRQSSDTSPSRWQRSAGRPQEIHARQWHQRA